VRLNVATVPTQPKIYHITHLRNLPQIVEAGRLWSDARRIEKGLNCDVVGMSHIKERRLKEIEVACHPGTHVGDYVPFYFCPRSIMLYILHMDNHPDLNYREGQRPIVHLQADLNAVVQWAKNEERPWAFTDRNAGSRVVGFFNDLASLNQLNWTAIEATQWSEPTIKEGKQAEFLVHGDFPWSLIERIGVCDEQVAGEVRQVIVNAEHRPTVDVERDWYY
jgi:hypothetical protein